MAEYRLSPAAERDVEDIWKYTRRASIMSGWMHRTICKARRQQSAKEFDR
jgi:plasmid stabilization system protein ParE